MRKGVDCGLRGLLVTFEGCDGSGKSTQLRRVAARLQSMDIEVVTTREPGGTPLGEAVRKLLLDPGGPERTPLAEALLYAACRAELVERVIIPSLASGKVVLSERFTDSTLAYQGFGGGLSLSTIETINNIATGGLVPDLTVVLDVNDPQAVRRRMASKAKDRIELRDEGYHARVIQGYKELSRRYPERIKLIDAMLPEEEVESSIIQAILALLETRRR